AISSAESQPGRSLRRGLPGDFAPLKWRLPDLEFPLPLLILAPSIRLSDCCTPRPYLADPAPSLPKGWAVCGASAGLAPLGRTSGRTAALRSREGATRAVAGSVAIRIRMRRSAFP